MKRVKQFIVILLSILLLSGCVKEDINMTINKDKSMTLEVQALISDSLSGDVSSQLVNKAKELEKRGYTVTQVNESGYRGYKITKEFKNIDDFSKNNGEEIILGDILEEDFDMSKLFKIEKGFLKDTYTAHFKAKIGDNNYNVNINNNDLDEDENDEVEDTDTTEGIETSNDEVPVTEALTKSNNNLDSINEENVNNEISFKYTVKLPYAAEDNNASEKSADKRVLTWVYTGDTGGEIKYTFSFYNLKTIIIIGGSCLLVLIVLVIIICKKKKKASGETLIHTDYDESIVGEITETLTPIENIPNTSENLEYTMPASAQTSQPEVSESAQIVASNQDESVAVPEAPQVPIPTEAPQVAPVVANDIQNNMQ